MGTRYLLLYPTQVKQGTNSDTWFEPQAYNLFAVVWDAVRLSTFPSSSIMSCAFVWGVSGLVTVIGDGCGREGRGIYHPQRSPG